MKPVKLRVRSVCIGLGVAGLAACSSGESEPAASGFPTPERYVSEYTPAGSAGRHWMRESLLPKEPQKTPWMLMYEVTRYPGAEPTREQQRAADALVAQATEAARRHGWFDFLKGLADGYKLAVGDDTHYVNEEYVLDDRVLDPERPEFLMYYDTPEGKKLTGFMFYVAGPHDEGPQIGGPLTVWHYHVWTRAHCLREGLVAEGVVDALGRCARGIPTHRSPEMLHVWFVKHPSGPFGTPMGLPPEVVAELKWE